MEKIMELTMIVFCRDTCRGYIGAHIGIMEKLTEAFILGLGSRDILPHPNEWRITWERKRSTQWKLGLYVDT